MIKLYGIGFHPCGRLWDDGGRAWEYVGRRRRWDARGNNEGLDIEPADEIAHAYALRIGDNIADIPGKPKRRVWNLNREQIKSDVRRQTAHYDFEIFKFAEGMIYHRA